MLIPLTSLSPSLLLAWFALIYQTPFYLTLSLPVTLFSSSHLGLQLLLSASQIHSFPYVLLSVGGCSPS